jgi:GNAT superfamily N-acetyltransferase
MKTEFIWVRDITEYPHHYVKMFGVKEITHELEIYLHHSDCEEWLLAVQGNELLGFSGYEKNKTAFVLKRAYVYKKYRGFGLYKIMLDMRISRAKESGRSMIQATTTPMSQGEFLKRGFVSTKKFKKFQTFRLLL